MRRASDALEALLARAPRLAHRRRGDQVADIAVEDVAPGDLLVVRPGELIPVDCVVLGGIASVDESALTGEPMAVSHGPGEEVLSGSVSLDGALEVRALRPSSESQYEQIVKLVRGAQQEKAPIGRLADHYAIVFTPLTLLMCCLAYLLTRRPEAVVAVLVVATPCPLILATRVAIISGVNRAARSGIIVKTGAALEQIGRATAVAFDKTGTLTVYQLPAYSPDYNPIEHLWKNLKKRTTHLRYFPDFADLVDSVEEDLAHLEDQPRAA